MDIVFEMITDSKIITGELQRGEMQYMMMKIYILDGTNCQGKPFWERKLFGEIELKDNLKWKKFMGGWYYLITRMTSALYTNETPRSGTEPRK